MTRQAFGDAFETGYRQTVRFLQTLGARPDGAAEIAQAAWARAWAQISTLRDEQFVISWVNTIARNLFRTSFRGPRLVDLSQMKHEPAAPPSVNLAAIDIGRVLQNCKPSERILLEALLEGYTCSEFAVKTGRSPGAVHAKMYRLRYAVRGQMQLLRQVHPDQGVIRMTVQAEGSDREAINRAS